MVPEDEQERHFRCLLAGDRQGPGAGELRQGPVGQDRVGAQLGEGGAEAGLRLHPAQHGLHARTAQGVDDQLHIMGCIFHQQQVGAHRGAAWSDGDVIVPIAFLQAVC